MVSKLPAMRKLNNSTTTLFTGLPSYHRFNLRLSDGMVIKIKKPFTLSFLFEKHFCDYVGSVQIWQSKGETC